MTSIYKKLVTGDVPRIAVFKSMLINCLMGLALMGPVYGQTTDEEIEPAKPVGSAVRVTRVNPESMGMLKGTDAPLLDRYRCDKTYIYSEVDICINRHPQTNGDVLTVKNAVSGSTFILGAAEGCFLKGVYQNRILVDYGTGNIRRLEIYDSRGKLLITMQYAADLTVEAGRLKYWVLKDREQLQKLPECAKSWEYGQDTLGFVQEYGFDLRTLEISQTGNSDCIYME